MSTYRTEEKAELLMDFLQWLSEQGYRISQASEHELASQLRVHLNYAQLIAGYLDFDWGDPQAEQVAMSMLLAIEGRIKKSNLNQQTS